MRFAADRWRPKYLARSASYSSPRERGDQRKGSKAARRLPPAPLPRRPHPPSAADAPLLAPAELSPTTHLAISAIAEAAVGPVPTFSYAGGSAAARRRPIWPTSVRGVAPHGSALICAALGPTGWWRLSMLAASVTPFSYANGSAVSATFVTSLGERRSRPRHSVLPGVDHGAQRRRPRSTKSFHHGPYGVCIRKMCK